MKLTDKFIQLIPQMDPVTFTGLTKLLGVRAMSEDGPRDFVDVFHDVVRAFDGKDRKLKREIIRLIKKSNSCGEDEVNADNT